MFVHHETEQLHPRTLEILEEVAKRALKKRGFRACDLDPVEVLGEEEAKIYRKVPDIGCVVRFRIDLCFGRATTSRI